MINVKDLTGKYLDNLRVDSVLDLGCGKGKKSLRFSLRGVPVVGIDKKPFLTKQKNFNFVQADIKDFEFKEKYDLIIASLILNFFKKEKAVEIIKRMKEHTNKNGYNFLICLSREDGFSKKV